MEEKLAKIESAAKIALENVANLDDLEILRVKFLGKKGALTLLFKEISVLPKAERAEFGKFANLFRAYLESSINAIKMKLEAADFKAKLAGEIIDVTAPGRAPKIGRRHPLTIVRHEIENIFLAMGFSIDEGPEVELTRYNFDYLNAPADHPSRDLTDTFYINKDILLRPQTSPVQVRTMLAQKPPIRMITSGRVYRRDEVDATHSPIFHQIEGLVVDKNLTMANFKNVMEIFLRKFYGANKKIRFRPHNFPFTEPSAEVDISCFSCNGAGCPICKNEGWIEILGGGMVHKNVLENCGVDFNIYSAFAFGMGLERMVMFKFGIDDIRHFYDNDVRFLNQF
jgi:phenylalanyl-tRNA synthetase alpha chain